MTLVIYFFAATIATAGFSLMFNAPRRTMLAASIGGGLSYVVYEAILGASPQNFILAGFLSAFLVGIIGEILARRYQTPATIFILPGLIPLVPGAGMYYAMSALIEQDYGLFARTSVETFFIAASLSLGVVSSAVFSRSLTRFKFYQSPTRKEPPQGH